MRVLISFIPPVFPNQNHGGSTKILKQVALYLAENGDEVTIVCNQRQDNKEIFYLHPRVKVMPIFKFKETYPNPYLTSPFYLSSNIDILFRLSKKHDILFIFDTDFIFTDFFPKELPILYSLRDFIYSEALQGAFLIRRGNVIVNSQFVKESLLATVGRFYPELKRRVVLIPNGVDTKIFRRSNPRHSSNKYINLKKNDFPVLLFPHRPESHKGIYDALYLVEKLVKDYGFKNTKLLIAKGTDEAIDLQAQELFKSIIHKARDMNIEKNISLHSWIPSEAMPEYYSIGTVTLCLGNVVEAFSNSTLESLACGTPVIAAKVASYRTTFPDWLISKVDPGDIDSVAEEIAAIIKGYSLIDMKRARVFIKQHFSLKRMCQRYFDVIHEQKVQPLMQFNPASANIVDTDIFMLPPWCYLSGKGIYNDYLKSYTPKGVIVGLFNSLRKTSFSIKEAELYNVDKSFLRKQLYKGFLIKKNYIR